MSIFSLAQSERNSAFDNDVEGHYFRGDLVISQKMLAQFDLFIQQEVAMFDDMTKEDYDALKLNAYYKTIATAKDEAEAEAFMNNNWVKFRMQDVLP